MDYVHVGYSQRYVRLALNRIMFTIMQIKDSNINYILVMCLENQINII